MRSQKPQDTSKVEVACSQQATGSYLSLFIATGTVKTQKVRSVPNKGLQTPAADKIRSEIVLGLGSGECKM